jgi:hypothetical protein
MPKDPLAVMLTFPARELSVSERDLVAEWLARAGDVPNCYISTRKSDDPRLYRRIVVTDGPGSEPTHLIHGPLDQSVWIKTTAAPPRRIEAYPSLRAALNSIRRVLDDAGSVGVGRLGRDAERRGGGTA